MNILVVDDDKEIIEAIRIYLENEGYDVLIALNGREALKKLEENHVHLVIMDVMMPQLDGIETTKKLREIYDLPVIILSAKSEDYDKILGLNIGADDYMTKPFNPLELIARVKSQLRRYTRFNNVVESEHIFETGGLVLNDDEKTVLVDGEQVHLTPVQYKILRLLMTHMGKVFSIEEIYEKVWDEPAFQPENTVAVHIRKIREQIEINPKEPKYLKVVWGIGYKVEKIKP